MRIPLRDLDPLGRPITAQELRRNCGYPTKDQVMADNFDNLVTHPKYTIEQLMNTDWMQRRGIYSR